MNVHLCVCVCVCVCCVCVCVCVRARTRASERACMCVHVDMCVEKVVGGELRTHTHTLFHAEFVCRL